MKNIIRVYKDAFRNHPEIKWKMLVRAIAVIGTPLLESAIPAMAIAMILEKDIGRYIGGISVLLIIDFTIKIIENKFSSDFQCAAVHARVTGFWVNLLKKCLRTDYCNVEPAKMQDKVQKGQHALNGDTLGVQGVLNSAFGVVCYGFGLLSYGTIVIMIDIRVLLIMIVMSVVSFFLHRHAITYSDKNTQVRDRANRTIGLMTWEARQPDYGKDIRIYHVENWFRDIFKENIKKLFVWHRNTELRWYFPTISDTVFGIVRDLLMYSILIMNVVEGKTTIAEFTFYVGIVAGFASWLSNFLFRLSSLMKTNLEAKAYYEFMETEDSFLYGEGEKSEKGHPISIEFRNVSFRYDDEKILYNLDLTIEKGRKIALVGNNGAGKTTLVKLLCGFYKPTEGEILINGIPTTAYDMDEYRKAISAVFQDGFISPLSIAMNVAGGKEGEIDYARVRKCLKEAGLWEKVSALPKQENSYLTQALETDGVDFSGGERQKLLVARALYQNGDLLILDEPTSALDPIAESRIYEKYNEMTKDKTALFISHRLASTKFCDEILFLEKGCLVERGTHEELMKKQGKYAKMFEIQSHYYKEEVAG